MIHADRLFYGVLGLFMVGVTAFGLAIAPDLLADASHQAVALRAEPVPVSSAVAASILSAGEQ